MADADVDRFCDGRRPGSDRREPAHRLVHQVAGTIGDLVDRRRFLPVTQTMMLLAATALGLLAIAGLISPCLLLALIFAVGTGQALTSPTWGPSWPRNRVQ